LAALAAVKSSPKAKGESAASGVRKAITRLEAA